MRAIPVDQARVAVLKETQMRGFIIGAGAENFYLCAGWDSRRRLSMVETNAAIAFIWPTNTALLPRDLFSVRLTTNSPFLPQTPDQITIQTPNK